MYIFIECNRELEIYFSLEDKLRWLPQTLDNIL